MSGKELDQNATEVNRLFLSSMGILREAMGLRAIGELQMSSADYILSEEGPKAQFYWNRTSSGMPLKLVDLGYLRTARDPKAWCGVYRVSFTNGQWEIPYGLNEYGLVEMRKCKVSDVAAYLRYEQATRVLPQVAGALGKNYSLLYAEINEADLNLSFSRTDTEANVWLACALDQTDKNRWTSLIWDKDDKKSKYIRVELQKAVRSAQTRLGKAHKREEEIKIKKSEIVAECEFLATLDPKLSELCSVSGIPVGDLNVSKPVFIRSRRGWVLSIEYNGKKHYYDRPVLLWKSGSPAGSLELYQNDPSSQPADLRTIARALKINKFITDGSLDLKGDKLLHALTMINSDLNMPLNNSEANVRFRIDPHGDRDVLYLLSKASDFIIRYDEAIGEWQRPISGLKYSDRREIKHWVKVESGDIREIKLRIG